MSKQAQTEILKALSNSVRCKVVEILMENPKGVFVSDLLKKTKISDTLLSHQLKILKDVGLIVSKRHANGKSYHINKISKLIRGKTIIAGNITIRFTKK